MECEERQEGKAEGKRLMKAKLQSRGFLRFLVVMAG